MISINNIYIIQNLNNEQNVNLKTENEKINNQQKFEKSRERTLFV